ncbi:hypothetical protein ALT_5098 [Aspergillus lentulus]|uniref:Thioredoxin domain-containing protein n=1 Tax=Aspergillus lentulus TaxID=293939 RepID=A0AAN6BMT7_ASPLE|nr:hypothetical protein CNMCM6069_000642 [Aspergillus lentulus]KAF4163801.1 hypothetical protein CNMCM6936_000268 [Aspergillus lentulus]KAF4173565.1 hypothetical protein CNMCM8060_000021 [Aspergillus lentulus]KAF4188180.1 hypothetical protein CNMCM7927_002277 [Aspergillus lentulus]KAF4192322.1 hypothetical protein CNMCM8694_000571 [Aspergillus lentulus]
MVELRKRKAPSQTPATEKKSKRIQETSEEASPTSVQLSKEDERSTHVSYEKPPTVGDTIDLDNFGGEVELNDGTKTTLKHLVDTSKSGIVLFTYPRASTPGCEFISPKISSLNVPRVVLREFSGKSGCIPPLVSGIAL